MEWNSLPAGIHACSSSHTFRRLLKTHCFNQAFSSPLAAHTTWHKCLRFGLWSTLCIIKYFIYLLTYKCLELGNIGAGLGLGGRAIALWNGSSVQWVHVQTMGPVGAVHNCQFMDIRKLKGFLLRSWWGALPWTSVPREWDSAADSRYRLTI